MGSVINAVSPYFVLIIAMEIQLDVSMLEPCEPLEQVLEAIGKLASGDYLRVFHRREPHLLYPMLDKCGFSWLCLDDSSGGYEIYIWKSGDVTAARDVAAATP